MATYIIGDVQGCFDELKQLLNIIQFDPQKDHLNFVGDIVNRGPQSLETLRFIKSLLHRAVVVLGNHDLYLLIAGYNHLPLPPEATLHPILEAPDKIELLEWLRKQPLFYHHEQLNYYLVHAGIPPQWSPEEALQFSQEVSNELQGPDFLALLESMYGNHPEEWHPKLQGYDRLRYIVNAFTRMRFCDANGKLDLENKTSTAISSEQKPWFEWRNDNAVVAFGHWASLRGQCHKQGYFALDTGCAWGDSLTALRIEDRQLFSISCAKLLKN